ncbi:hypothetical protein [Polaromonas sp. UC242_47]|uniref:hypothetical protein n=1 Tax=Polaromonas sp. UC242_47 TaxID=3374626 RepID=UPI0037A41384
MSTLFALSQALRMHDHVPAWVYVDRGAGYRSKMLSDEVTGFYSRFDIGMISALPGNPHGKGWIERWFRTCRDKHDKFFAGGQVYCGDDMAPETNRRLSADLNKKDPDAQAAQPCRIRHQLHAVSGGLSQRPAGQARWSYPGAGLGRPQAGQRRAEHGQRRQAA